MTTPLPLDNPPGKRALSYRAGRYGDFRQSMLARLSDTSAPFAPLNALRTRAPGDPTIALIDAFAAVGEVLTFYQERLANEGFLRTATEPRSLIELARLTGYRPKAGLASSVFLSFTVDPASSLTIPAGARAQSVPPPGQTAQSFETEDALPAQGAWNALQPRLSRPTQASADLSRLFVDGLATGLKASDPLLLVVDGAPTLRRVSAVTAQADRKRTMVDLQPAPSSTSSASPPATSPATTTAVPAALSSDSSSPPVEGGSGPAAPTIIDVVQGLAELVATPPPSNPSDQSGLRRTSKSLLTATSDAGVALAAGPTVAERSKVYAALAQTPLAPAAKLEVHAFKAITAPSGARAPPRAVDANGRVLATPQEWNLTAETFGRPYRLTIKIAPSSNEGRVASTALMREVSTDSTTRSGMGLSSTITYRGGAPLVLDVEGTDGSAKSGTLPDVGEIVCTLRSLDATGLVIAYDFTDQPVSLLVSVSANGQATVVNEIGSSAMTDLAATENSRERLVEVNGQLALRTGSTSTEQSKVLYLDGIFDTITPGSWVAFDAPVESGQPSPPAPVMVAAQGVSTVARSAYGQTAKVTRLALESTWIDPERTTFERAIRETAVFANSTPLTLVNEDIVDQVPQAATLELDGFTPGLASGRWLIVSGERVDLPGSTTAEVAMLAGAAHQGDTDAASRAPEEGASSFIAGETVHTVLTFAEPLAYAYKRETVSILGNIARASQGESVDEILGSGSGVTANQGFTLKKPPLTYVSADTPSGSASTLRIYVNGLEWGEVDSFATQGPSDRVFVTHPSTGGGVTVRFGDGIHGARLPTGSDNVRARYRSGLGSSGNATAGTITTLLSRPLGLKAVTNPLAASGGADAEAPDDVRDNVPLGLVSLSRLVSVRDYEDFARAFAGIAKASAKRFAGPDGPLVHVTVAGASDDTLDPTSDMWAALSGALDDFGDAEHEVELAARTAKLALISANIAVDPDRLWSDVEPVVRSRLLDAFSFRHRRLGESLHASDVIAVIQAVPGVSYVDLRLLSAVAAPADAAELKRAVDEGGVKTVTAHLARVAGGEGARRLLPAELVYLSDALPDMLVLNEAPA